MNDLYKRLGVDESAGEGEVRAALGAAADSQTREAAEFIVLDPRRREVYDRNRRVVTTIGRLRANLGLNLTRFWPRGRFADFTIDLAPSQPARPRGIDPMRMAWAFGVGSKSSRRRHWVRKRTLVTAFAILLITAVVLALLFVRPGR